MFINRGPLAIAVALSVVLHAMVIVLVGAQGTRPTPPPPITQEPPRLIRLEVLASAPPPPPPNPVAAPPPASPPPAVRNTAPSTLPPSPRQDPPAAATTATDRAPAYQDAPPAPTAQEWALAATYTLKNSKRYRYNWGQQLRSMMGTAVEGPDQGAVRFRVEISPAGYLVRLDTLWSTSPVAEQRARQAVQHMPPLPPTPNGQPLIFETLISFQPFSDGGPPIYQFDCLPEPPAHRNRFVWDGHSPQVVAALPAVERADPQAIEDCRKQLPQDTLEAESAHDQRQLEQWRSSRLGR